MGTIDRQWYRDTATPLDPDDDDDFDEGMPPVVNINVGQGVCPNCGRCPTCGNPQPVSPSYAPIYVQPSPTPTVAPWNAYHGGSIATPPYNSAPSATFPG